MTIYKISTRHNFDEHSGYYFYSALAEAKKEQCRQKKNGCQCDIEKVEVAPTKKGIISALNRHASHPDNG